MKIRKKKRYKIKFEQSLNSEFSEPELFVTRENLAELSKLFIKEEVTEVIVYLDKVKK